MVPLHRERASFEALQSYCGIDNNSQKCILINVDHFLEHCLGHFLQQILPHTARIPFNPMQNQPFPFFPIWGKMEIFMFFNFLK